MESPSYRLTSTPCMHVGSKISGMGLSFLSAWRRRYSLNYTLWRTGIINCKSLRRILLISASQAYASLQRWRTPEELLAYLSVRSKQNAPWAPCKNKRGLISWGLIGASTICQPRQQNLGTKLLLMMLMKC